MMKAHGLETLFFGTVGVYAPKRLDLFRLFITFLPIEMVHLIDYIAVKHSLAVREKAPCRYRISM